MTKTKKDKERADEDVPASPVESLRREMRALQRELGTVARLYTARLKDDLRREIEAVIALSLVEDPSREQGHQIREMRAVLRHRKLKPEKGRRKDLRQIDRIIEDLGVLLPVEPSS